MRTLRSNRLLPASLRARHPSGPAAFFAALLGLAAPLAAQPVFAPAPSAQPSGSSTAAGPAEIAGRPAFEWGAVALHPSFTYRFTYGDGIQSQPGRQTTTSLHSLTPDFLLNLGRLWTFDYAPTLNAYSSRQFKDTFDHSAQLTGTTTYESWTFRFSQAFASASPVLAETAQQTKQKTFGTDLSASFRVGARVSIDLAAAQSLRFVGAAPLAQARGFSNTREWSTTDWLRYRFAPGLSTGLGVALGYTSVARSPDMVFTRLLAELDWSATQKTSLQLQLGGENRRFQSGPAGDLNNPILNASLLYRPFEQTRLTLGASRTVSPSYFTGEVAEGSGLTAQLSQRLLEHFTLTVGYSQQRSEYTASSSGGASSRSDRVRAFDVRLGSTFQQRGTVAVTFRSSENSSNLAGFSYDSQQVGFEIGYRF